MQTILAIDIPQGWAFYRNCLLETSGEVPKPRPVRQKVEPGIYVASGSYFLDILHPIVHDILDNAESPDTIDYVVCEEISHMKGRNIRSSIALAERTAAIVSQFHARHLYFIHPSTWMRGRKPPQIKMEAMAIFGDAVGEHQQDAIMLGNWFSQWLKLKKAT